MPKTVNSGTLVRRVFSVYPYHLRGLAERSKAEGVSVNTLVRDALNLYLGIEGKAPDRIARPWRGKMPLISKRDPHSTPDTWLGYAMEPVMPDERHDYPAPTERPNPPPGTRRNRLRAKKRKSAFRTVGPELYVIRADGDQIKKDIEIPYTNVLRFWKLIPSDADTQYTTVEAMIRDLAPRAGLTVSEAYDLYPCFEWDHGLRERLERDEVGQRS